MPLPHPRIAKQCGKGGLRDWLSRNLYDSGKCKLTDVTPGGQNGLFPCQAIRGAYELDSDPRLRFGGKDQHLTLKARLAPR
jgi:hypothetical protein